VCIHREFSRKLVGERILKIGPHLPKLLSTIKRYTFLGQCTVYMHCAYRPTTCVKCDLHMRQKIIPVIDLFKS